METKEPAVAPANYTWQTCAERLGLPMATAADVKRAKREFARMRSAGEGPPWQAFGQIPLYPVDAFEVWRLSRVRYTKDVPAPVHRPQEAA